MSALRRAWSLAAVLGAMVMLYAACRRIEAATTLAGMTIHQDGVCLLPCLLDRRISHFVRRMSDESRIEARAEIDQMDYMLPYIIRLNDQLL